MYTLNEPERAARGEVRDVYGTNITRALREAGFKGAIFIRSANDDADLTSKNWSDTGQMRSEQYAKG